MTDGRLSAAWLRHASDERLALAAQAGDASARETLILRHGKLVRHIARSFHSAVFSDDDLQQAGTIGLIAAVDRFRSDGGASFATYAYAVIRGELQHLLRDQAWAVRVPRSLQELGRAATLEEDRLTQVSGSSPSTADLSEALGEDSQRVAEALLAREAFSTVPPPAGASPRETATSGFDALTTDEPGFELAEHRLAIQNALPRLPAAQRRAVVLRYWGDMTQERIARQLGVSQMQVSRLLRSAMQALGEAMAQ
jgi:RNA polymerase sigma-B factor